MRLAADEVGDLPVALRWALRYLSGHREATGALKDSRGRAECVAAGARHEDLRNVSGALKTGSLEAGLDRCDEVRLRLLRDIFIAASA